MNEKDNDVVKEVATKLLPHFNGLTMATTEQIIERLLKLIKLNGKLVVE